MQIQELPIECLQPYEQNPRKIKKANLDRLIASIRSDPEMLRLRPLLVNKVQDKYIVYAGCHRLLAAKHLNMSTVPCIVEEIPIAQMKKRIVKDNSLYADWDKMEDFQLDFSFDWEKEMPKEVWKIVKPVEAANENKPSKRKYHPITISVPAEAYEITLARMQQLMQRHHLLDKSQLLFFLLDKAEREL